MSRKRIYYGYSFYPTADNTTFVRSEPKPVSKKTLARMGVLRLKKYRQLTLVHEVGEIPQPNILNKYERRKYRRVSKHVDRHYPF